MEFDAKPLLPILYGQEGLKYFRMMRSIMLMGFPKGHCPIGGILKGKALKRGYRGRAPNRNPPTVSSSLKSAARLPAMHRMMLGPSQAA